MRQISVASLLLLTACATTHAPTVAEQCGLDPPGSWSLLPAPPPEAQRLLDLVVDGKSVRSQLGPQLVRQEDAWFRSKNGNLLYCRYTPADDSCKSHPETVDFAPVEGAWKTDGALVLICVDASKRVRQAPPQEEASAVHNGA